MSVEYGIFNDEGCVERGFYSESKAQAAVAGSYPDDGCIVAALCPEHDEQPRDHCEECYRED